MSSPLEAYRRLLESGEFLPDSSQKAAATALERLYQELLATKPPAHGWRRRLTRLAGRSVAPPRGVYLWGPVGRGKTRLMDLFHDCLPIEDKERRHFHRFMADVHADLRQLRQHTNPLDLAADRLAARTRILCFDELAVTDVADAMILGKLFSALFARGVALAVTSNIEPRKLYEGGLQRKRFLPAIHLIERHTQVLRVDGSQDYRLGFLEKAEVFLPAGADADRRMTVLFRQLGGPHGTENGTIEVLARPIHFRREADGAIWFNFAEICDGPRSQDDYIELSKLFHTVFISDVPRFDGSLDNPARRFIALVDEFYDRRVKLILSAQCSLANLYTGHRLKQTFARTMSRLQEMQSHDYLAAERKV